MKSQSVIIIGAGIGGICSAIHLAKRGLHVTVYEKSPNPGGRCDWIEREGHHFDTGPTLMVMQPVYEAEFSALGGSMFDLLDLKKVDRGRIYADDQLVDGRFPDYEKVIPRHAGNTLIGDRESLRQSFLRASILSNEKYRGVRLLFEPEQLTIRANNPEQEEAEEIVAVEYGGARLEIGFNVSYLQDVLNVLRTDSVRLSLADANSSALIEGPGAEDSVYVVMPMRL